MNEEQNVINIYYTKRKDLKYTVNYLDEEMHEELHEPKVAENQEYEKVIETSKEIIEIDGYEYASCNKESITLVTNEEENVINIYYTVRTDIKYKVEYYYDGIKEEEATEENEATFHAIIDNYEDKIKENYVLVEEPEEKTVLMEEDEIILEYYYVHISSGVIEKHIDEETGEILYNTAYEGNEGDNYKTGPKEFKGYSLVEEKYPENAEGTMTIEAITVNYYYKKKAEVTITVKYIDKETNEEIQENVVITDYEGEEYKTEQKEIEGYEFIKVEGEPKDTTVIGSEIPKTGMMKQVIAVTAVSTMTMVTIILLIVALKGIALDKKKRM